MRTFGGKVKICDKMDVSSHVQASQATVKDVVGEKAQQMFQEFLEE